MKENDEILPGFAVTAFLEDEKSNGWNAETRRSYRNCLYNLLEFVASHGPPDAGSLELWRQELQKSYGWHGVNLHLAAANNYFRWCGRPDLVQRHCRPAQEQPPQSLTRAEYLQLLGAARVLHQRRSYLLVKLFATTGLPLQCLDQVTAELIQAGEGTLDLRGSPYRFRCPPSLQEELLAYMQDNGIYRGPVFITRSGQPIDRSNLCRSLQELCRQAHVPEEKGNPRSLRKLYKETQDKIRQTMDNLLLQAYDQLLETEQNMIGWQEDSSSNRNRPAS